MKVFVAALLVGLGVGLPASRAWAQSSSSLWRATDIAAANDGSLRMMWVHPDQAITLWSVAASGEVQSRQDYGPYGGWSAKALAVDGNGKSRVLWTHTDGSVSLWVVNAAGGREAIYPTFGPYAGWTATDIAADSNNTTHVLWNHSSGAFSLWQVNASGVQVGPTPSFGPYDGWGAKAISVGNDGKARVLLRHTSGAATLWTINAAGVKEQERYLGAVADWTARDIATGSDNKTRILWNQSSGATWLWVVRADGYHENTFLWTAIPNWGPVAVSAATSGNPDTRFLWNNTNGQASSWAVNAGGGLASTPAYGPFPPSAPTNLTAQARNNQVSLSWNPSLGATGYKVLRKVLRSDAPDDPYTLIETPTATSYTDSTAYDGTTYSYVVVAVDLGVESPNSNEATATPQAQPVSSLSLTATEGDKQVLLQWTNSIRATDYEVWRTRSGDAWAKLSTQTSTSYTDNGLTNGTLYEYYVRARNQSGYSAESNHVAVVPHPDEPNEPGPPTFGQTTETSVVVIAPPLPFKASSLTLQIVSQSEMGESGFVDVARDLSGDAHTIVSQLTSGGTYYFRYVAVGPGGSKAGSSAWVKLQAPAGGSLGVPGVPRFLNVGSTSLQVAVPPTPSDAQSLTLQKKLGTESESAYVDYLAGIDTFYQTVVDVGGLTPQTTYSFRFVSVGVSGNTNGPSANVTTTIPAPDAPGTPQFSNVTQTSATVLFPVMPARATSLILQQMGQDEEGGGGPWTDVLTVQQGDVSRPLTGLTPSTSYLFRCVAVGPGGSTEGETVGLNTSAGPPDAPQAPRFKDVTESSVVVVAPSKPAGAASLTLQGKYTSQPDSAYFDIATGLGSGAETPVDGLDSGQSYTFRYRAVASGASTDGTPASLVMPTPVITWGAGDAISCAGIRPLEDGNVLHPGQEGRLNSFLATDWDDRYVILNGASRAEDFSDPCSYSWTANSGSFKNNLSGGNSVVWVAPSTPGTYTLKLTVNDQNNGNKPTANQGTRDDAQRGFNDEPLHFSVTIVVQ